MVLRSSCRFIFFLGYEDENDLGCQDDISGVQRGRGANGAMATGIQTKGESKE